MAQDHTLQRVVIMASSFTYSVADVVTLDYNDLVAGHDLSAEIERAYGMDGVGVLTVKNVPGFVEARQKMLPLAREFAMLPEETKEKYVHKDSYYSFGWSHGKENVSILDGCIELVGSLIS